MDRRIVSVSKVKKIGTDSIFGERDMPPPVKASPSPVCLRRPVSLRDASSASRGGDTEEWRSRIRALRDDTRAKNGTQKTGQTPFLAGSAPRRQ